MVIFEFDDYKKFMQARLEKMPQKGRGEFRKIAAHLNVHPTMISHVFRGDAELAMEQAVNLSEYLGLRENEAQYLLDLVQLARAGTEPLRRLLRQRIKAQKEQSNQITSRIKPARVLGEKEKALFYSEWYFSAIRLLTAIPGHHDIERIAKRLKIPRVLVSHCVDFLLEVGLCKITEGRLSHAVQTTHVPAESPLAGRHHKNWRLKAMERYSMLSESELAFTMPVALSKVDSLKVKAMILEFIQKVDNIFDTSPSEKLSCLNIDWIDVD